MAAEDIGVAAEDIGVAAEGARMAADVEGNGEDGVVDVFPRRKQKSFCSKSPIFQMQVTCLC